MIYRTPDDAVLAWWRLTERESAVRALDPFAMVGRVPAYACAQCGNAPRKGGPAVHAEVESKGGGFVDRCRRCGSAWRSTLETILKGQIQTSGPSPGSSDARAARRVDLALLVAQVPAPDSWVYGLYLWTDQSYEDVAGAANAISDADPVRFLKPDPEWTTKRVRTAVRRSRRALTGLLQAAGMMPRAVPVLLLDGSIHSLEVVGEGPFEVLVPEDASLWITVRLVDVAATLYAANDAGRGVPTRHLQRDTLNGSTRYLEVPT